MRKETIWTIGYARTTQESLLACLQAAKVEVLADIRAIANSRRPGFSKTSLKAAVEQAGMAYAHIRELGAPKQGREAARKGDIVALVDIYGEQLETIEARARMLELQTLAMQKRVCLLCYCEESAMCHRGILCEEAFSGWRSVDLYPLPAAS